jgi:hypothetical protein
MMTCSPAGDRSPNGSGIGRVPTTLFSPKKFHQLTELGKHIFTCYPNIFGREQISLMTI